jgi:putative ABC transport system permease protein
MMENEIRQADRFSWCSDFVQDVRYAGRVLRKSRGFSAVAILTLALGIGANTAIFSIVDATLLKPLPFLHPEKIVALWETESAPGSFPLSGEDYLDWKAQNRTFEDMTLFSWPSNSNVTVGSSPEGATVVQTEANFFPLLGVNPQVGRTFAKGEDQKGGSRVAILSHAFWKSRFAGAEDVLGKTISLNGQAYTLVGVMPAWYRTPAEAEVWIPLDMSRENLGTRGSHQWKAIGRIKQGIVLEQARFDLKTIAATYEKQFPATNRSVTAIVSPMREDLIGDFSTQILVLFGAVGLVLLIACANVANLLLARSTSRQREIGVRSALGASRGRLVRQLLTESVLLSLAGGVLGVGIAFAGVAVLRAQLADTIPEPNPVAVDFTPLFFTFLICIVVGVLFGLAPAVQFSSVDCGQALKSKGVAGAFATRRGHWLRNFLVTGEIALSLALLAGAGLLLRTFAHLRSTDVGIRGENVLTATVRLTQAQYTNLDQGTVFYDRLLEKLATSPGVRSAAVTTKLPLQGGTNGYIQVPGIQMERESGPLIEFSSISPYYFRTMGIPLLQGREFIPDDFAVTSSLIREAMAAKTQQEAKTIAGRYVLPAIINRTMAQTFWPKESPIGKIFINWVQFRVVGVVGDVNQMRLRERVMPEAYNTLPWDLGVPTRPFSIVVQAEGAPKGMTNTLRSAVQSLDPNLALFQTRTMPEILSESIRDTSYEAGLLGAMAMLALVLASVGTYGVMSYVVGQRTNEIGIRMALGARPAEIMAMVGREMFSVVGIGIAVGFFGALAGAKVMKDLLVGVAPFDPLTYAGVSLLLAVVALAACYVPVRRAMRIDPVLALRYE